MPVMEQLRVHADPLHSRHLRLLHALVRHASDSGQCSILPDKPPGMPDKPRITPDIVLIPATGPITTTAGPNRPRPPLQPIAERSEGLTDKAIGEAISAGVNWMINQFDPAATNCGCRLAIAMPTTADGCALCLRHDASAKRFQFHAQHARDFMKGVSMS